MVHMAHAGFRIKSVLDGTLYRARVERSDGGLFHVAGSAVQSWETPQYMDAQTAAGQAVYAIDSGRVTNDRTRA